MKTLYKTLFILTLLLPLTALAQDKCQELGTKICTYGYATWTSSNPIIGFENAILEHLGFKKNHPNKEKIISKFFNENNACLTCNSDHDMYIRENEHILKRSLALAQHDFLYHMAESNKYEIDWNFYEIVDGKKETILDYIDMILNTPDLVEDYDIPELKTLVRTLEDIGAKRGRELKD